MKRTGRLLISAVLCAVILVQLAYLSRGLFEGRIGREIEAVLSEATGAIAKVGSIRGNWLNHVIVDEVELVGGENALIQEVQGLRVELWFSPLALLAGDLGGLQACRVTARTLRIRTDGELSDQPAGAESEGPDFGILSRALPGGASVEVSDFSYGTLDAEQVGNLRIVLEPGTGDRRLRVDHPGVGAEVSLGTSGAFDVGVIASVEDPGHILRCLGVNNEFRQGELGATCQLTLEPLRLSGQLRLSGAEYLDREIDSSRVNWVLDGSTLRVREGSLELPGVSVHTAGLLAPSPLDSESLPLDAVRGNLDLDITDLTPYSELVPELNEWLPLRGRLHTWVDEGRMHIVEAWVEAEGATLTLERGTVVLAPMLDAATLSDSTLGFELMIPSARTIQIPEIGELSTSGSIRGSLSGSLSAPQVEARAELGPTSLDEYRSERLSGNIEIAGDSIALTSLSAFEIAVSETTAASRLEGSVEIVPNEEGDSTLGISVRGQASSSWMDLLDVEDTVLRSLTAPSFAITGDVTLGGEFPDGLAELSLAGIELPPHPPAELLASVAMTRSGELSIEQLELRGPATIDLTGVVPLRGGPASLSLHAPEQDLGFPTSFLPGGSVNGTFTLDVDARGDTGELAFEVGLSAVVEDPAAGLEWPSGVLGSPPTGSARLEIRARQASEGIGIEQLVIESDSVRVTGQGSTPLRWDPDRGVSDLPSQQNLDLGFRVTAAGPEGMDLPLVAEGRLRIGSEQTTIEGLDLTAGPGRASGSLSTDAGWRDWLFGDPGTKALGGELVLEDISLEIFPATALGLDVLEGNLSGRAALAGTIENPEPSIDVEVSEVAVRVGTMPRLEDVSARLSVLSDRARLEGLSGTMGAGTLGGELVLTANGGKLWDSPAQTSIAGSLWGRDLLLANERNLRLRGNVAFDLQGSAEELIVGGSVQVTSGRYARRLTLLPDLRARGGTTAALEDLRILPIDSLLGQRVVLDLALTTENDFEVRTHFLDTDLVADLRLRGQASLARLEGVVSSSAGILRLPGTTLRLDSALVTFPSDRPTQPELLASASGRRHGIQIQLTATGPLQEPEIQVTSIPVFPPQELWTLVTTGALPSTLRSRGLEGQAALVGGYLFEELAAWYSGDNMEDSSSFLDRFTFVSGQDISENGQESLVVEFSLSDLVYLQGERDVYEHYNGGVVIRWRF